MSKIFRTVAVLAGVTLPGAAFAHTGHGTAGFIHGFGHPLGGLDHILAMVLVGVLAWQIGSRALYAVPASFVLLMAAGGALAVTGIDLPLVETGIVLSIIVLGAVVAFDIKAPVAAAAALVGAFAIFHGHAHGAEMPVNAEGFAYGAGFMGASALLHAAGIGLGFVLGGTGEKLGGMPVRAVGGAAALTGVAILAELL